MSFISICFITVFVLSGCQMDRGSNKFAIYSKNEVTQIFVSQDEAPQILRAVVDLQNDIEMVTGKQPDIINNIESIGTSAIVVGTLASQEIKSLLEAGKLEESQGMDKMFESFLLKSVQQPFTNVNKALVVAGSDALGTVYGIYEISERIGVSPLYWWCDIVPKKQKKIVLENICVFPKQPSIRYRGIFINDEEALTQWSENTSEDKLKGNPSPEKYKRVFELLLRLRANSIWPAMMTRSSYFFEAKDENGTPVNPKNATEYGIYIGSSHCENMARNNYDEWYNWASSHKDMYDAKGVPVFDYTVNPKSIEAYWQERLDESKDFNMIYTLGIRGVHDSPFKHANMKNPTLENKVKMLQQVIDRQREMIKETFGAEDAVPQIFVPYEETGELYNGENKNGTEQCKGLDLPEDVMMVWTEDNYGCARQLPGEKERLRKGGNGIYYHMAYQGYPGAYDWLTTTPLPLMQEQLQKVYEAGAQTIWIVNVGDVKPAELGLQYFMAMANDIKAHPKNTSKQFLAQKANQHFNIEGDDAEQFADLLTDFYQSTWSKKPETLTPFWDHTWEPNSLYQYYSLYDFGDEAQIRIETARELESRAKQIYDKLEEDRKAPFWHLAYYPIRSTRLMLEKTAYYRKNQAYAKQGRLASVNVYKALSEQAEEDIQADLEYYKELSEGKWNGIMDPYAQYNLKERIFDIANIPNNLVYEERFQEEASDGIGTVCEGQLVGTENVVLQFSYFEDNYRFVDVFNKDIKPNPWSIESDTDWLNFSTDQGEVTTEERVWVNVNWKKVNVGENNATITVKDNLGYSRSYLVVATKNNIDLKEKSYIEGNGFVAIETEHYTKKQKGKDGAEWHEYFNYGYKGSSMFLKGGSKVEKNMKDNSARLEYSVYFATSGTFYGELYRIPTLNEGKGKTIEIAVGVDDDEPIVLKGVRHKGQRISTTLPDGTKVKWGWTRNVLAQMEKIPFQITIDEPGYHTIKLYQRNSNIGIDRFVICTNEQAKMAQKRSLLGAPESYNNVSQFRKRRYSDSPRYPKQFVEVDNYPELEPLTKAKFNFAMYAMVEEHGFKPVTQKSIFNPDKNLFGWRQNDVKYLRHEHNENTLDYSFWQRDGLKGRKEAIFYVRLKPGKYNVTYFMGDTRTPQTAIYSQGTDYQMTFEINGKELMSDEKVLAGKPVERTVEVIIDKSEMMEIKLSGKWIINALIIDKK